MKDENLMPLSGKLLPKVFVFALLLAAGGCMSDSDFMPGDAYIPPASGNTQDYAENPMDVGSETDFTSPVLDPFDPYDPNYGSSETDTDNMSDLSSSNEDESEVLIVEEEESSDETSVPETAQSEEKSSSELKPTDSASDKTTSSTNSAEEKKTQTVSSSNGSNPQNNTQNLQTYTVQKGDSLSGIAAMYGITVSEIAELNGIADKNKIRAGQVLKIPANANKDHAKQQKEKIANGELYIVKAGDSLSVIAQKFGVKTADLAAANKLDPAKPIYVGQKLVIPAGGKKVSSASSSSLPGKTKKQDKATPSATASKTSAQPKTEPKQEKSAAAASSTTTTTAPAATSSKAASAEDAANQDLEELLPGISSPDASASQPTSSTSLNDDSNVLPIVIDRDMTLEEIAEGFGRSLDDVKRLNPQYKPGEKIKSQTTIILPFF